MLNFPVLHREKVSHSCLCNLGVYNHFVICVCLEEGWSGLIEELEMELKRISSRNLGRDNRIIADHARESRLPFLDEDLVSFLNSLPIWKKADLNFDRGLGEKILLRLTLWELGFGSCALTPKRALQFGSRIAKLEGSKEKGNQVCDRL